MIYYLFLIFFLGLTVLFKFLNSFSASSMVFFVSKIVLFFLISKTSFAEAENELKNLKKTIKPRKNNKNK